MPKPSSFVLALNQICTHFLSQKKRVYSEAELVGIIEQNRQEWHLAKSANTTGLIRLLEKHAELQSIDLYSEAYGKTIRRYSLGKPSAYELALSIKPTAYLSHATAAELHGISADISENIFLNCEQSPKRPSSAPLIQANIDRAFQKRQRRSNLIYTYGAMSVTLIAGKNTDQLSVQAISGPQSESLRATSLERTLIDLAVRPDYAGGVDHTLNCYRAAAGRANIDELIITLQKLDYTYPYHQSIGFLLDSVGCSQVNLAKLNGLGIEYDFYLTHNMPAKHYSKKWRLYYPESLKL